MDSHNPVIFDISSDEESAFDELSRGCCDDDHDWLTQLLEIVDKETNDSDEVVVVGEYIHPKPKLKSNKSSLIPVKEVEDDDCVVLDGDPDKPGDVVDETTASDGGDVLVVGEKGQISEMILAELPVSMTYWERLHPALLSTQNACNDAGKLWISLVEDIRGALFDMAIACRDYPHPRHLCAKFPFNATPHETHCDLCHCYVCDSLAPCVHWGTGVSSIDHCHATDKLPIWKSQRENFRLGKNTSVPVLKFSKGHFPVAVPQVHQVAPIEVQLAPNLGTQNQVCRPTTIRACSSARMAIPNVTSQIRNRQPGCVQGRNRFMHFSVSQQANSIRNNAILRDRGQKFVSSTMFKRPGIVRPRDASTMNQSVYGSSNMNCASVSQYTRNAVPLATANIKNPAGWQGILPNMISESYACPSPSQPSVGSVNVNTVAAQPEVFSEPIPLPNDGQNIYQFGNQTQNVLDSSFPEFDLGWINNLTQRTQQISAENVHLQGTVSNNEPMTAKQFIPQLSTELHYNDHGYESFLLGQFEAVVSEGCVPVEPDVFSPEPSGLDAGMLCFDFETSWNGLTQV